MWLASFLALVGAGCLFFWFIFPMQEVESTQQVRRWFLVTAGAAFSIAAVAFVVALL